MNKSISRRNFLTGAAVALGGAAAAGVAGCAPSTPQEKLSETGAAASGTRWSWETKPEPIADDEIVETIDTEICIVGLGSAGTTSAMAAAQSGAKVVVLQKLDKVITNGWCVAAFNSKMFLDAGQTYDLADIYFKFADLSNGRDNPKVVKTFLNRSGEVVDYVIRQTPDFTPVMQASGHTYGWYINNDMATRYDQFHKLLDAIAEKAVAAGAEIRYNTPAVQLVQDESGRVTGVIGESKEGYVKVNASKGVILCTGDTSDDQEMLEAFCPIMLGVQSMHGAPCNTGDGHKMALWAGASMDPAPHTMMMHFDPTWMPEGNAPYSGIPWLRVNLNGERFGNENLGYQSHVTQVRFQPEMTAFQIIDKNWDQHARPAVHRRRPHHQREARGAERGRRAHGRPVRRGQRVGLLLRRRLPAVHHRRLPRPRLDLRCPGGPLGPRPARRAGGHPGRLAAQRKSARHRPPPYGGAHFLPIPSPSDGPRFRGPFCLPFGVRFAFGIRCARLTARQSPTPPRRPDSGALQKILRTARSICPCLPQISRPQCPTQLLYLPNEAPFKKRTRKRGTAESRPRYLARSRRRSQ